MTVPVRSLHFADAREAEDLAAFLARLIHYDRAAAVRLQAWGGALAVFGRPPSFEVLAIRTARLGDPVELDVTVSAGELLESLEGAEFTVPATVTGPPWAGLLPPRGGWRELSGLPEVTAMRGAVAAAVAEFRTRDEQLPAERRTRAERDRIGRDIWSRTVGGTGLPLRAVHAAQSLGFLRPGVPVALLSAGSWLRLRTPFGSIAVRTNGLGGLSVTPTRPG
ncbi:hypothetical protein HRW07_17320 [Streptomyces lunaelactis]|uniref:hypothetical protein n=1 Tax=Streptomyces lunaelactis TaxID=1535768 RepID=UPI001584F1E6|nr:hypothetical protein [Streptomyces lunaelactis]NUL04955.1 hypothetical protein [Streptomyces lunaelactis]